MEENLAGNASQSSTNNVSQQVGSSGAASPHGATEQNADEHKKVAKEEDKPETSSKPVQQVVHFSQRDTANDDQQLMETGGPANQIDRYHRYRKLMGRGAFKKVYLANDTYDPDSKDVAWNVVNCDIMEKDDRRRIEKELQMLQDLKHDHILHVATYWEKPESGEFIFISTLAQYGTLRERVKKRQVRLIQVKGWSRQILLTLDFLHQRNVIHRDIKCDNMFVSDDGKVILGDFGLSTKNSRAETNFNIVGTPQFMAPELYEEDYDELVDVYAFGMSIIEMITSGRTPYEECDGPAQIFRKVLSKQPPKILGAIEHEPTLDFIKCCIRPKDTRPSAEDLLSFLWLEPKEKKDKLRMGNKHGEAGAAEPNGEKQENGEEGKIDTKNDENYRFAADLINKDKFPKRESRTKEADGVRNGALTPQVLSKYLSTPHGTGAVNNAVDAIAKKFNTTHQQVEETAEKLEDYKLENNKLIHFPTRSISYDPTGTPSGSPHGAMPPQILEPTAPEPARKSYDPEEKADISGRRPQTMGQLPASTEKPEAGAALRMKSAPNERSRPDTSAEVSPPRRAASTPADVGTSEGTLPTSVVSEPANIQPAEGTTPGQGLSMNAPSQQPGGSAESTENEAEGDDANRTYAQVAANGTSQRGPPSMEIHDPVAATSNGVSRDSRPTTSRMHSGDAPVEEVEGDDSPEKLREQIENLKYEAKKSDLERRTEQLRLEKVALDLDRERKLRQKMEIKLSKEQNTRQQTQQKAAESLKVLQLDNEALAKEKRLAEVKAQESELLRKADKAKQRHGRRSGKNKGKAPATTENGVPIPSVDLSVENSSTQTTQPPTRRDSQMASPLTSQSVSQVQSQSRTEPTSPRSVHDVQRASFGLQHPIEQQIDQPPPPQPVSNVLQPVSNVSPKSSPPLNSLQTVVSPSPVTLQLPREPETLRNHRSTSNASEMSDSSDSQARHSLSHSAGQSLLQRGQEEIETEQLLTQIKLDRKKAEDEARRAREAVNQVRGLPNSIQPGLGNITEEAPTTNQVQPNGAPAGPTPPVQEPSRPRAGAVYQQQPEAPQQQQLGAAAAAAVYQQQLPVIASRRSDAPAPAPSDNKRQRSKTAPSVVHHSQPAPAEDVRPPTTSQPPEMCVGRQSPTLTLPNGRQSPVPMSDGRQSPAPMEMLPSAAVTLAEPKPAKMLPSPRVNTTAEHRTVADDQPEEPQHQEHTTPGQQQEPVSRPDPATSDTENASVGGSRIPRRQAPAVRAESPLPVPSRGQPMGQTLPATQIPKPAYVHAHNGSATLPSNHETRAAPAVTRAQSTPGTLRPAPPGHQQSRASVPILGESVPIASPEHTAMQTRPDSAPPPLEPPQQPETPRQDQQQQQEPTKWTLSIETLSLKRRISSGEGEGYLATIMLRSQQEEKDRTIEFTYNPNKESPDDIFDEMVQELNVHVQGQTKERFSTFLQREVRRMDGDTVSRDGGVSDTTGRSTDHTRPFTPQPLSVPSGQSQPQTGEPSPRTQPPGEPSAPRIQGEVSPHMVAVVRPQPRLDASKPNDTHEVAIPPHEQSQPLSSSTREANAKDTISHEGYEEDRKADFAEEHKAMIVNARTKLQQFIRQQVQSITQQMQGQTEGNARRAVLKEYYRMLLAEATAARAKVWEDVGASRGQQPSLESQINQNRKPGEKVIVLEPSPDSKPPQVPTTQLPSHQSAFKSTGRKLKPHPDPGHKPMHSHQPSGAVTKIEQRRSQPSKGEPAPARERQLRLKQVVEVYSQSKRTWCTGMVFSLLSNNQCTIRYQLPNTSNCNEKTLDRNSPDIRIPTTATSVDPAIQQPPPTSGAGTLSMAAGTLSTSGSYQGLSQLASQEEPHAPSHASKRESTASSQNADKGLGKPNLTRSSSQQSKPGTLSKSAASMKQKKNKKEEQRMYKIWMNMNEEELITELRETYNATTTATAHMDLVGELRKKWREKRKKNDGKNNDG